MDKRKKITILGIETSCDETAAAVLEIKNQKIVSRSNVISSQVKIHAKYGGIVPEVAARCHAEKIIFVLQKALKSKKLNLKNIDAIAVTNGPGLMTSLFVGIEAAKTLAYLSQKSLVPINHIAAHIYANFVGANLNLKSKILKLFPAICLVVSGGHTELILMKDFENFKKIGQTFDDAAGECFDKVAKILGLEYPGGPAISKQAAKFNHQVKVRLPRPMINSNDFNFSFSGLKTACLYKVQKDKTIKKNLPEFCAEFQQAVIDVLVSKTIRAANKFKARSIVLGGGVVANKELRKQFKESVRKEMLRVNLLIPDLEYSTDNAAMIAVAGYFKLSKTPKKEWSKKFDWRKIKINPVRSL